MDRKLGILLGLGIVVITGFVLAPSFFHRHTTPQLRPNSIQQYHNWDNSLTGLPGVAPGPVAKGRVALLMPSFNMPEAVLRIVQALPHRMGKDQQIDVFVVDNGPTTHPLPDTIEVEGSQVNVYIVRIPINVQTTHGFHMAMAAARGVAFNQKFQYEGYWLWITSIEIPEVSDFTPRDILTPLLTALRDNPKLGIVTPALLHYPETLAPFFRPMMYDPDTAATPSQLKYTTVSDILGMMVRGDVFAQVTVAGFQPTILRAWGLDLDLCATVRQTGYEVAIHHGVTLDKRHSIGYIMNRMSEDISERERISTRELDDFLKAKYGVKYWDALGATEAEAIGGPKHKHAAPTESPAPSK